MSFHNIEDSVEMDINYSPGGEYPDVDDRIIEFIRSVYSRGMDKFYKEMIKYSKKIAEEAERLELVRLKKKYE